MNQSDMRADVLLGIMESIGDQMQEEENDVECTSDDAVDHMAEGYEAASKLKGRKRDAAILTTVSVGLIGVIRAIQEHTAVAKESLELSKQLREETLDNFAKVLGGE